MYNSQEVPFELIIDRIGEKFHKLPSEVLKEDWEWLSIIMVIDKIDKEEQKRGEALNQLKNKHGRN